MAELHKPLSQHLYIPQVRLSKKGETIFQAEAHHRVSCKKFSLGPLSLGHDDGNILVGGKRLLQYRSWNEDQWWMYLVPNFTKRSNGLENPHFQNNKRRCRVSCKHQAVGKLLMLDPSRRCLELTCAKATSNMGANSR